MKLLDEGTLTIEEPCIKWPQPQWYLKLTPDFCIEVETRPNAWVRFWQRVLLGITWESIE